MAVLVAPRPPQPGVKRVNQDLTPTQSQIDYERDFAAWVSAVANASSSGIPFPTLTTIGGVKAATAPTHQFQRGIDTSGNPLFAQPAAGDISGLGPFATASSIAVGSVTGLGSLATLSSVDLATQATGNLAVSHLNSGIDANSSHFWRGDGTWASVTASPGGSSGQVQFNNAGALGGFTVGGDGSLDVTTGLLTVTKTNGVAFAAVATSGSASDLGTGTLPAARLPNPSATTLGGIQSRTAVASQWINSISTSGVPSSTQPAASDLSDGNVGTGAIAHQANPSFTGTATFSTISASTVGITTATIITAHTTNLDATTATLATATIGSLTTNTVSGGFANLSNSANAAQLHLSGTGNDNGAYFVGYQQSGAIFAGGASFDGTNWTAKYTTASGFSTLGGTFFLTSDSGLTIGNTFSPTIRFAVDATGAITTGIVPVARVTGLASVATSASATDLTAGTLPIARGGTGDTGSAWTTYSPTLSAGSGTFTSAVVTAAAYRTIGKSVFLRIYITVTTNGTAASWVQITLPVNATIPVPMSGWNDTTTKGLSGLASSGNMYIRNYDGTYPAANGSTIFISGVYESV